MCCRARGFIALISTETAQAVYTNEVSGRAGYLFVGHRNVLIASWTAQGTGPLIAALAQVIETFVAAHPEGISSVHLIAAGLPLADAEAREALREIMKQHAGALACAGTVLDGTGFWASATRGMLVGLQVLAPARTLPTRTSPSSSPGCQASRKRTGITLTGPRSSVRSKRPLSFGRA